jgi:membrane-associated protease RseP (regulator of RpoE activity)
MSGPKHLWSGDWERESEAAKRPDETRPPQTADSERPHPESQTGSGSGAHQPPSHRRSLAVPVALVLALAVITGVAFGLNALLNGGGSRTTGTVASAPTATTPATPGGMGGGVQTLPQPTAPQPTAPQPTPQPTAPQQTGPQQTVPQTNTNPNPAAAAGHGGVIYWDGMQIETITPGLVVIDTVKLNSQADRANLEPGDQLVSVNGRQLSSATDIASALKGLHRGQQVPIQVVYGSSSPQSLYLILGAPPSQHP